MVDSGDSGINSVGFDIHSRRAVFRPEDAFVIIMVYENDLSAVIQTDRSFFHISLFILDLVWFVYHYRSVLAGSGEGLGDTVDFNRPAFYAVAVFVDKIINIIAGRIHGGGDEKFEIVRCEII